MKRSADRGMYGVIFYNNFLLTRMLSQKGIVGIYTKDGCWQDLFDGLMQHFYDIYISGRIHIPCFH